MHTIINKFNAVTSTYDKGSIVEQAIAKRLLDKLVDLHVSPKQILDLGCATGLHTNALQNLYPLAHITGIDCAFNLLSCAKQRYRQYYICGDALTLPFSDNSHDLLFINCTLAYISDLDKILAECQRILNSQGILLFTTLGPASFTPYNIAGHHYIDMHHIGDKLARLFNNPVMEMEMLHLEYDSEHTFYKDMQYTGHVLDKHLATEQSDAITIPIEVIYGTAWNNNTKNNDDKQYVAIEDIKYIEY